MRRQAKRHQLNSHPRSPGVSLCTPGRWVVLVCLLACLATPSSGFGADDPPTPPRGGCVGKTVRAFASKAMPYIRKANPFAIDAASKARKALRKEARAVLGRKVTFEETRAIERANELGSMENGVTAAESARRSRILRENNFTEADVQKLARSGLLKNHPGTLAPIATIPEQAFTETVKLRSFDKTAIKELQTADKEFRYVIDVDDQIFLLDDAAGSASGTSFRVPEEPLWIARNEAHSAQIPPSILVKETGLVKKIDGQIRFQPQSGTDLTGGELEQALEKIQAKNPETVLKHPKVATAAESKVLNCMDVMSGQLAGKSFVMDSLIAGNLISIGSITATEMMGAGRWNSKDGPRTIAADILGGNANSLIATSITKAILLSDLSRGKQLAVRAGLGLVTTRVQDQVYKAVLPGNKARERAEKLTEFNTWHFYLKLPLNVLIDEGIMKKLPVTLFDVCKRGGALKIFLSPQAVRIYERSASTAAYFFLRGMFVDEGTRHTQNGSMKKIRHTIETPLNLPKRPHAPEAPEAPKAGDPQDRGPAPTGGPRGSRAPKVKPVDEPLAILPPDEPVVENVAGPGTPEAPAENPTEIPPDP